MSNDMWVKMAEFLGNLNGEWEEFLKTLSAEQQNQAEKMKDCLEDFASVQERRAYIQGYADCVQVLFHMGLLRKTEGLKWPEKME